MITAGTADYRAQIETALQSGWRARGLYAAEQGRALRVLLAAPEGRTRVLTLAVPTNGVVPSIVDLAPAMGWDEREAHDLYGTDFAGHEPLRPLLDHAAPLDAWTVPVQGHDPYQVAVGPIHASVIESGHFRFHVVGDRILHLDARLMYKHRGLERSAEGMTLPTALSVVSRACAGCSVANSVAYAVAAEQALGSLASPAIVRSRTLLLELERAWNHLNDIAAICAGVGMASGNSYFLGLTERARRINAAIGGHRFLTGSVQVGSSPLSCDIETLRSTRGELAEIRDAAEVGWRSLAFNASFQSRLEGVGVIDSESVASLGVVGPAARAAGVADDARHDSPDFDYRGFEPVTPGNATGDVRARLEQRMLELRQTFVLLERLLAVGAIQAAVADVGSAIPVKIGVGVVESARGATSCVVEHSEGAVARVRLRTASYANWPAVAEAARDNLLPDFPLINKSFELCYACADR